jgi:hypothetical protein
MQDRFAALTVNDLINENTRSWNLNMQSAILNTQPLFNAFGMALSKESTQ